MRFIVKSINRVCQYIEHWRLTKCMLTQKNPLEEIILQASLLHIFKVKNCFCKQTLVCSNTVMNPRAACETKAKDTHWDVNVHTNHNPLGEIVSLYSRKVEHDMYYLWHMKKIFITNYFFRYQKEKQKSISSRSSLVITARCRSHTCAAPSGSSAACRCVWLSASCLWTERSVPGSETATCTQSLSQRRPTRLNTSQLD